MANSQGTFLAYRNWLESADTTFVTSTDVVGSRAAENVLTQESDDFWRVGGLSVDNTAASLVAQMKSAQNIDAISVQFPRGTYPGVSDAVPNFAASDTIRYRLLDAAAVTLWDSGVLNAAVVPGYMTHYVRVSPPVAARQVRIDFDATSRADAGFFDVGNIGAWSAFEPAVGLAYPAKYGWRTNKQDQRTSAGRLYTTRFEPMRRWSLVFDALTDVDSARLDEMIRYTGGSRQVFVRRGDLPVGRDAMLAIIAADGDMDAVAHQLYQYTLLLEEFI